MDIPSGIILATSDACQSPLKYTNINIIIIVCGALGLLWAAYNFLMVRRVDIEEESQPQIDEEQPVDDISSDKKRILLQLSYKISDGSMQFIKSQYVFSLAILIAVFLLVWFLTEKGLTTALALLVGGLTNMISSLISLIIASQTNYRIAFCGKFNIGAAFRTAYNASCAISFGVTSLNLLALIILIDVVLQTSGLQQYSSNQNYYKNLFEAVAGYALGTSLVSIFARISGGVFAAGSEVGADLAGKIEGGLPYKSPSNPATVTRFVGQNIGQLLGGVAQFTSTLTETVCVVFVLSCNALLGYFSDTIPCNIFLSNLMFPLMTVAVGLFFCVAVSAIATNFIWIDTVQQAQSMTRIQLLIIALVTLGSIYLSAYLTFPPQFTLSNIYQRYFAIQKIWVPCACAGIGVVSVLILSLFNQFFASPAFFPVQSLVEISRSSTAANLANGLALGYIATILPIMIIAIAIYFCNMLLGFYGVGLAGIGILSGMPIYLAQHLFAPLSSTAFAMCKICQLGGECHENSEFLDEVGKIGAARSRAFIVKPAAFAGISLFGGYLFNTNQHLLDSQGSISITEPLIFVGILLGAMVPFLFSGLILPAVNEAASQLVSNTAQQYREDEGILQGNSEPDFGGASGVVSWSSLKSSIVPALLVTIFPLALGFSFGIRVVAGYLVGLAVSGVQFSLSGIISGQAWKSTRKLVESGSVTDEEGKVIGRESQCYKTSLIGEQVGDSLEKTASTPLSVIIKLSGIVCVVFGSQILKVRG